MADKIVYSQEFGDLRNKKNKKKGSAAPKAPSGIKNDGIVRVQRESKGRGGKTVTVVYGVPLSGNELSLLAASLKQKCGTGGTVKDGVILIQGDKSETVIQMLTEKGYTVKKAGG